MIGKLAVRRSLAGAVVVGSVSLAVLAGLAPRQASAHVYTPPSNGCTFLAGGDGACEPDNKTHTFCYYEGKTVAGFGQGNNNFYNFGVSTSWSAFDELDRQTEMTDSEQSSCADETDVWLHLYVPAGLWGQTECALFASNGECASYNVGANASALLSVNASYQGWQHNWMHELGHTVRLFHETTGSTPMRTGIAGFTFYDAHQKAHIAGIN
jgi:hypothetical protein